MRRTVPKTPTKNQAAVSLGRKGGLKGGRARADYTFTPAERKKIAQDAAKKRWNSPKTKG